MDHSVSFARHFARLLWLVLHEPANIEEQKAALRALVTVSRDGDVGFAREGEALSVNGSALPPLLPGVPELVERMRAHGRHTLDFPQNSAPATILVSARTLAGESALAPRGAATGAPAEAPPQAPPQAAPPAAPPSPPAIEPPAPALHGAPAPRVTMAFEALGLIPPEEHHAQQASSAHAHNGDGVSGLVAEAGADLFFQFAGTAPTGTPEEIIARVDAARDADALGRSVDELVLAAEQASRDNKGAVVGELLHALVEREARATSNDAKRTFTLAFRRVAKQGLLRGVTSLLPRKADAREKYVAVLVRAGEDGADALIDQLTHAQTSDDRRVYFDVLLRLNAGVPALVHMLGDPRWFVARNAAELLGEMQAKEAESPLAGMLSHNDERVRRAATESLLRLNTPTSVAAVEAAAQSSNPSVRVGAIAALGARRDGNTANTLVKALDAEGDEEVQLALLAALGKVGSPDAVERLLKAAEPEGRFFRKKSTAFRAAAVLALGDTRTPSAQNAIRGYLEDREKEVRDAALRALANTRRSTTAQAVVEE